MGLTSRTIDVLNCVKTGDGSLRLVAELKTECYSSSHLPAAFLAWIVAAVVLLGFPVIIVYLTVYSVTVDPESFSLALEAYGYILRGLRVGFLWFRASQFVFALALVAVTSVPRDSEAQLLGGIIVFLLQGLSVVILNPFERHLFTTVPALVASVASIFQLTFFLSKSGHPNMFRFAMISIAMGVVIGIVAVVLRTLKAARSSDPVEPGATHGISERALAGPGGSDTSSILPPPDLVRQTHALNVSASLEAYNLPQIKILENSFALVTLPPQDGSSPHGEFISDGTSFQSSSSSLSSSSSYSSSSSSSSSAISGDASTSSSSSVLLSNLVINDEGTTTMGGGGGGGGGGTSKADKRKKLQQRRAKRDRRPSASMTNLYSHQDKGGGGHGGGVRMGSLRGKKQMLGATLSPTSSSPALSPRSAVVHSRRRRSGGPSQLKNKKGELSPSSRRRAPLSSHRSRSPSFVRKSTDNLMSLDAPSPQSGGSHRRGSRGGLRSRSKDLLSDHSGAPSRSPRARSSFSNS